MGPSVPEERLAEGGWSLVEETTETLVRLPAVRVRGRTRLYEDGALRERLREAAGVDRRWRFFFATRVEFVPGLAPGVGPATLLPTVTAAARRAFADDLRERGFEGVRRGRTERLGIRSGARARLQQYLATLPADGTFPDDVEVEGWFGAWTADGEFRLAGGAHPRRFEAVREALGVEGAPGDPDATGWRRELFELVRRVE
ncbi:hypothetical protein BRC94_03575 [Halobacteriales archaeon QS_5_70_17]|nr:MAG: hypothetical protein BRC94_03575 [Halobacteriales archaeon QS_5_70_17]